MSPLANELIARTANVGIPYVENFDHERTPALVSLAPYPRVGSGIVLYDFGNPWPPVGNRWFDDGLTDPHAYPRRLPEHNAQMVHFLRTGEIIDVCGGAPCQFAPPQ